MWLLHLLPATTSAQRYRPTGRRDGAVSAGDHWSSRHASDSDALDIDEITAAKMALRELVPQRDVEKLNSDPKRDLVRRHPTLAAGAALAAGFYVGRSALLRTAAAAALAVAARVLVGRALNRYWR